MNGTVFRESLRQSRRTVAVLSAASGAFYYLVLLASSSFLATGSAGLGKFFENPPKAIGAFLGGTADFFHPSGWVAAAMSHPVTIALMTAAALTVSVGAVATEVERGTIDLVLTRPVGREPYILGKALAALVAVTAAEAGGLLGVLVARATIARMKEIPLAAVARAFAGSWALFAAFAMIALLVSTRNSLRGRANGIAVGIVVASFFVNFIALLIDGLSGIRFASPFHYFDASALIAGTARWQPFVLVVLAGAALAAATVSFARRDLTR